jgi:Uma2 family endonuclease
MPVSEETYLRLVLEDPDSRWELHCGRLQQKPPMTARHNDVAWVLGFRIQQQLPLNQFRVRVDAGRARAIEQEFFIPDVIVVPAAQIERFKQEQPTTAEVYSEALPFVTEVWSPSTGTHDRTTKLQDYQRRGDLEIWLLNVGERTLRAFRKQPDNTYTETVYRGGKVQPVALPNVTIDLDELVNL